MSDLLGRFGTDAMQRIMQPRVWAPGWTDDQLAGFSMPWTAQGGSLKGLRVSELTTAPPAGSPATGAGSPRFDVVHYVGDVAEPAGAPSLWLGGSGIFAPQAADLLRSVSTRLLILQLNAITPGVQTLADTIVMLGGPPVLAVAGENAGAITAYFRQVYANLLHNAPLTQAAEPQSTAEAGLEIVLALGSGADSLLRFDGAIVGLLARLDRLQHESVRVGALTQQFQHSASRRLHSLQWESFKPQFEAFAVSLDYAGKGLARHRQILTDISSRPWHHEFEGVVPLQEAATAVESIESDVTGVSRAMQLVQAQAVQEEARAPRVLNANFALPGGRVLLPSEGLVAGTEYDFLLDVGPRWTTIPSLVEKGGDFPEDALNPASDGYQIDVILVSEDFIPHMVSGSMWLPRDSGRSFPVIERKPAGKSGPITLRVRTPTIGRVGDAALTVRARLCLYYENNLLQSAVVRAGVVRSAYRTLSEANNVLVDFVLSDTFADVEPSFARRAVKMTPDDTVGLHPIKANLVLNDDGDRHRFIVRRRLDGDGPPTSPCSAEAWTPYDPMAALDLLDRVRSRLAGCFYARNARGQVQYKNGNPVTGLDNLNGKPYQQFAWDVFQLAQLGAQLFNRAFANVQAANAACNPVEWIQELRPLLRDASIIQVARTVSSQYVFPWSLVYDYPLIDAERVNWKTCQVLEHDWGTQGRRQGPPASHCPFDDADWHQRNIICPYGFWGLRHIIEEPASVKQPLATLANGVLRGDILNIGVATVSDVDLLAGINAHLQKLRSITGVQFSPAKEADDWASLTMMLRSPDVAYFLCHGEYDATSKTTYLRLGSGNRVSPDDLLGWAKLKPPDGPDLVSWKQRHPFIFINGCHTSALKPGEIVSFVGCFSDLEAGGVLGTEISVLFPVAAEVGEFMFKELADPAGPTLWLTSTLSWRRSEPGGMSSTQPMGVREAHSRASATSLSESGRSVS